MPRSPSVDLPPKLGHVNHAVRIRMLLHARVAVFALFAAFGIVLSTWAVHLPALKRAVGMSNAMVGTTLLVLGVGSLAGMQLCGVVIDRLNTEMIAVASGAALSAAIIVPLTATTLVQAMAGAFLLGVTAGWADVGMNAIAVIVERDYGRPIMSAFHAVFSVGSVFGSLLRRAGFALHLKVWTTSSTTTALCLIIVACAFVGLRGYCAGDPTNDRC